ncbi:MAG TPA: hypothetical protein GX715_05905 [Armatimonadetes bacterium]|jgi:predicted phosphohydrolase|nr:hypothetical protein [Armatimonadota bacterium]
MGLFAIADLHLSRSGEKPMDIFGAHWTKHDQKIKERWMEVVAPEDTVLVVGDISWGLRFEEALPDLEWLAALPGTKVMVRGNHDYWWSSKKSAARLKASLPASLVPLHKTSYVVEVEGIRVGVAGTRGWVVPPATPHDAEIIVSEEQRLRASLASLPKEVDRKIGMIHIPPFTAELRDTSFVEIFREAGVTEVVYGHVHRGKGRSFEGSRGGITYRNVAVDQIDFRPYRLL